MPTADNCVLDIHTFAKAIREAKAAPTIDPLLALCGLCQALLTACTGAISERMLDNRRSLDAVSGDDERTAQQMGKATQMSAAYYYRNAHQLPYTVRHGRSVRFSWSGYLKSRERNGPR